MDPHVDTIRKGVRIHFGGASKFGGLLNENGQIVNKIFSVCLARSQITNMNSYLFLYPL